MKPQKIAILVNLDARQGRAACSWTKLKHSIIDILPDNTEIITYRVPCDFEILIEKLIVNKNVDGFISAGGDGSLNYMINVLLKLVKKDSNPVFVGGIGLGSSNDFHKPCYSYLQGIPVKIDWDNCQLSDVGEITYEDTHDVSNTKYFIINASMGITAEANYRFNNPKPILKSLKRYWLSAAIFYAAVKAIFLYRNYRAELQIDNKMNNRISLSNLSVIKNSNISGSFRYEQKISTNDSFLGLNYCDGMNKFELLNTLFALMKGEFKPSTKRKTYKIRSLRVLFNKPKPIETDGEVFIAKRCCFTVIPNAIHIMK